MAYLPNMRTVAYARNLIQTINLDLSGLVVYTEAATGGYCVTAGLAAMAGAQKVFALAKDSRHGTADEAAKATLIFASLAGVENQIQIVFKKSPEDLNHADIITNSGHVRPLDRDSIKTLKPTAVIPLMYEAWEFRPQDVDLIACREDGISVAGTNESHPDIGILKYLGMMAIRLLLDGGIPIVGCNIALWSDNKFCHYIAPALSVVGAEVRLFCPTVLWNENKNWPASINYGGTLEDISKQPGLHKGIDALLLVMSPSDACWIGREKGSILSATDLAEISPGAMVAQYWGNIDRSGLQKAGLSVFPENKPSDFNMGILPSDLGLIPVVRLQAGGLKVGEIMSRSRIANVSMKKAERLCFEKGFGQVLPLESS